MDRRTLWSDGTGGYISCSRGGFDPSPVYTTAAVARDLIRAGIQVHLPDGYTEDTLDTVAWMTGFTNREVRVDPRQAQEIVSIARVLLTSHADHITAENFRKIREILVVIPVEGDPSEAKKEGKG